MFDIGFFELTLIVIVALLVLGPEKLPHAVRMTAAYWGRLKRSFIETKAELEEQLALEEIRKQIQEEREKVQRLIDETEKTIDIDHKQEHLRGPNDQQG